MGQESKSNIYMIYVRQRFFCFFCFFFLFCVNYVIWSAVIEYECTMCLFLICFGDFCVIFLCSPTHVHIKCSLFGLGHHTGRLCFF